MPITQLVADPNVVIVGDGPPLVLAHGAGGSVAANFTGIIESMSEHRTLIGIDYPGSGGTPADAASLDLDVLADSLVTTAVDAGFDRFPMLGLSLGSAVAVTAAIRHPERVTGLVLTVGFASADQQIRLVVDTWTTLAAIDRIALAKYLVSLGSPAVLAQLDDSSAALAIESTFENHPEGGAAQARLAASVDVTDLLAAVDVPTLVVAAGQDRIVLPATTRALAQLIPNAELVEYPDAGHIFTEDEAKRWMHDVTVHLRTHHL